MAPDSCFGSASHRVVWYGVAIWQATPSMPRYGNIILSVATALALIVGCGLTALTVPQPV